MKYIRAPLSAVCVQRPTAENETEHHRLYNLWGEKYVRNVDGGINGYQPDYCVVWGDRLHSYLCLTLLSLQALP